MGIRGYRSLGEDYTDISIGSIKIEVLSKEIPLMLIRCAIQCTATSKAFLCL